MVLTTKKINYGLNCVTVAGDLLALALKVDELVQAYFANGFSSGSVNALVDGDFVDPSVQQLSAANLVAFITAAQAVQAALPQGTRDNLRKILTSGLPPS